MKDGFIKVGIISPVIRVADPATNVKKLIDYACEAYESGARVLVTPALALTSCTASDLLGQKCLLDAAELALAEYMDKTAELGLLSFIGLPFSYGGKMYNVAAVINRGTLLALVPQTYFPVGTEFGNLRFFASAPKENTIVRFANQSCLFGTRILFTSSEMPVLSVAAEIGYDLWVSTPPSVLSSEVGANLIVNLAGDCETVGKHEFRKMLVSSHSAKINAGYVFAEAGAGESGTDMVFSGNHMIAERGTFLAEAAPFSDITFLSAVLDIDKINSERTKNFFEKNTSAYQFDRIEFVLDETETETPVLPRLPFVPQDTLFQKERCNLILEMQSRALAARMERAYAASAVVGVSGGLDSTLALLIAVRAVQKLGLPANTVHAVTMPCFGTTARTKGNAERLAESLGAKLSVIDIRDSVMGHFKDIGHNPDNQNVVYENAQARERTQILMDIANSENGMVVGTGDLSELALGWATYNGDHMSMYGVNSSIPKTMMRFLVETVANRYEEEGRSDIASVLHDVLSTPVSPELLPPKDGEISQCTEGIVGPYELHDFFLYYAVRFGFTPGKILRLATASFQDEYSLDIIYGWEKTFFRRFFTQQFKRSCLPDGPKVGSVTLSPRGDWAMPSDASSAAWLNDLDARYNEMSENKTRKEKSRGIWKS